VNDSGDTGKGFQCFLQGPVQISSVNSVDRERVAAHHFLSHPIFLQELLNALGLAAIAHQHPTVPQKAPFGALFYENN